MSRIRTVKPEFWTSEQIVSCSFEARLLFIGIWNFSDDAGIHAASYIRLKGEIFPIDPCGVDDIKCWVNELISNNLLREYAVDDKLYWIVTGWKRHQKIERPTYRYPLPQSELVTIPDNSTTNRRHLDDLSTSHRLALDDNSMTTQRVIDDSSVTESNGMESNGKDKDICEVSTSPVTVSNNKLASTQETEVMQIFKHWQTVMNHPRSKLDNKRATKIKQALKLGYTLEELKLAIDGCSKDKFYMGDNDRNQRYDGIDLIFRDADHIDRFIRTANPVATTKGRSNIFAGVI